MPDAGDMIPLSDVAGTVKLGQVFRRMALSNVLETSLITFFSIEIYPSFEQYKGGDSFSNKAIFKFLHFLLTWCWRKFFIYCRITPLR